MYFHFQSLFKTERIIKRHDEIVLYFWAHDQREHFPNWLTLKQLGDFHFQTVFDFYRRLVGLRPATLLSGLQLQKRVGPDGRQF